MDPRLPTVGIECAEVRRRFRTGWSWYSPLLAAALVACGGTGTETPARVPPPAPVTTASLPTSTTAGPLSLEGRLTERLGPDFNGTVLVARNGEILFGRGFGMADAANGIPNELETHFRIGSITKQFTAMGILILESRGLLASTDPVCQFIEKCPPGWEAITIEHLVGHTSGVFGFTELEDFDETQPATPAETIEQVAGIPLPWEPGENYRYSNSGYVLLGMVIEQVAGISYEAFLEKNIFAPLGMEDTGYDHGTEGLAVGYRTGFDPASFVDMSVPYAAGALYSTVLDLLRWDEALYTDKLVPIEYLGKRETALVSITDRAGYGYGYGVALGVEDGRRLVFHDGGINGFYSHYNRYPEDHLCVVILTNREDSPSLDALATYAADLASSS
jgi:CubicO group peptidase (beta-lactamase class C family)